MTRPILLDGKDVVSLPIGEAVLHVTVGAVPDSTQVVQLLPHAPGLVEAHIAAAGAKEEAQFCLSFKRGSAAVASTFQGDPRVSRSLAPALVTTVVIDVKLPAGYPVLDSFMEAVNGPNVRVCVALSKRNLQLAQLVVVHTEPIAEPAALAEEE